MAELITGSKLKNMHSKRITIQQRLGYGVIILAGLLSTSLVIADTRGLNRTRPNTEKISATFDNGVYRAVVIGNNAYRDRKKVWRSLKTAVKDAEAVAEVLKKDYGFADVKLLKNATRRDILNALNRLAERSKPEDSVLVYYAGHGWQNEKTQEAFWIPVDAQGTDDSYYLSNVRIKEKLSVAARTVKHTLLISDSCFSGSLLDTRGLTHVPVGANDTGREYYRKISKRRSVQILAAGGKEYVDDNYRNSGHSPFTYYLLNELKLNEEPYLSMGSLAVSLQELVAKNAQQTPESGAFRQAGDDGGQFVFSRINVKPKSKVKPTTLAMMTHRKPPSQNPEFDDWQALDQNNAMQVANYIKKYPNGAITPAAKLKFQEIQNRIADQFSLAKLDIKQRRFAMPKGNNAMERYQGILKMDERNAKAKTAMRDLFTLAANKAEQQIRAGEYRRADEYIQQAEMIDPENRRLAQLHSSLDRSKQARRERAKESKVRPGTPAYQTPSQHPKPAPSKDFVPPFSF